MNLKHTGILFAAAFALSVGVQAATVSQDDASAAAQGWAAQRVAWRPAYSTGPTATKTTHYRVAAASADVGFFTVKLSDGTTVVLSGDDEETPVLAYTKSDVDLSNLDPQSPLYKILQRDLSVAKKVREQEKQKLPYALSRVRAETLWAANRARWSNLRIEGNIAYAGNPGTMDAQKTVTDVRVEPLVKTQWAQSNVGETGHEWACYNYLTPDGPDFAAKVGGNKNNAVCGCVATAMAQVLKYFEYPTAHIITDPICRLERTLERDCYWKEADGTVVTNKNVSIVQVGEGVDKAPTPYEWDKMPLRPGVDEKISPLSPKAAEIGYAIGHLTYDCGVAVGMQYSTNWSGAYSADVPNALRKTFHIGTAVYCYDGYDLTGSKGNSVLGTIATRSNALQRVMFSNFDVGLPVIVGLEGHEVVADGYGYEGTEPFVHFNMGWAGQGDLWYNIPNLEDSGYYWINDVTYNIFTNQSATLLDKGYACLSGRCLDRDGNPLKNAKISIYVSGTDTKMPSPAPTTAAGIWGVAGMEVGKYDIYGESEDGTLMGCLLGVELKAPNAQQEKDSRGDDFDCVIPKTPEDIGNSWGNDLMLVLPNFKIEERDLTYQTLEDALMAVQAGETIRVLKEAVFTHSATGLVNCTIKVADGVDATNAIVSVSKGVRLHVGSGARILLEGVHFECVDDELVMVQKEGRLAVKGESRLPTVVTSDTTGFELAGQIWPGSPLIIDCPVSKLRDQQFGVATCDAPSAEACRTNIVNKYDLELGGVVLGSTDKLVWDRVADPATAFAKYVEPYEGGRPGESYYNSLTTLFRDCTNNATITILRDCGRERFKGSIVTLDKAVTITGPGGVSVARDAGFVIAENGKLTLEDVTFSNYVGSCLFEVDGGELVLGAGATLTNLATDAECQAAHGTTYLRRGRLTMLPGALIMRCDALHYDGHGGGIYAESGVLDLQGGSVERCLASKAGAGIYVYNDTNGLYGTELKLSGNVKITDNYGYADNGSRIWDDNLCLWDGDCPFAVTGAMASAAKAIGVRYESETGNGESNAFACVEAELDASQLEALCRIFVHDTPAEHAFGARAAADGKTLFWAIEPDPGQTCDPTGACFAVYYDLQPDVPYYYADADTTFACLDGDATVYVTNWTSEADKAFHYKNTIEINHRVVLVGLDDGKSGLRRHAECPIYVSAEGELILTNIVISGSYSEGGEYPLIQVDGGKLELQAGADVRSASSNGSRACGGIVVWNGGLFTMQPGSRIQDCRNNFTDVTGANRGVGGGVLIDHATAYFNGGRINGCSTAAKDSGGAVCLANEAVAYVQGPLWIWGNGSPANNIVVEDNSRLYLAGPIANKIEDKWGKGDSHIGVDPGYRTDTNIVAYVAWEGATQAELEAAAKYFHPAASDSIKAIVGTNATLGCNVLLWSPVPDPVIVVPVKAVRLSKLSFSDGKPTLQCTSDDSTAAGATVNVEVWAAKSLTDEWELESTQTVKLGEDLKLNIDSSDKSKFWKIIVK